MKKQAGFTLIELVVVIVILGILAATALPKFVDLTSDARKAVVDGLNGSMQSANTMIYGKAAVNGVSGTASSSVTIGASTVNTAYGYAKTCGDLKLVLSLTGSNVDASTCIADATSIQVTGGTAAANCSVTVTAPTVAGGVPTYTVVKTGC